LDSEKEKSGKTSVFPPKVVQKEKSGKTSVFPLCLALSHLASAKPISVIPPALQGADTDAKTSSRDLDSKHAPDLFQLRLSRRIGRTLVEAFHLVTRR
jgi:hypothetical protein